MMNTFLPTDILIECVPNFSEGRNQYTIDAIADVIKKTDGVKLLHIDIGSDANRTVYTFVGKPDAIVEAAYQAIKIAYSLIDMEHHQGKHPRMGACDVCPFIPLQNIDLQQTIDYTHQLAEKLNSLNIPIFLYEASAKNKLRQNLENIRKGEYESISTKMYLEEWQPDYGNFLNFKRFGMMALGARNFLIAYNINLKTKDLDIGKKIASTYRKERLTNAKLSYSKAIAWYIEEYNCVQISTNITNFEKTSIFTVFDTIQCISNQYNIETNGSELIGLIPQQALLNYDNTIEESINLKIDNAIHYLGLNSIKQFNKNERILEYLL